jgi:hypothetical protein
VTNNQFENIIKNIKNIPEILDKSKHELSKIHVYAESGAGLVKVKLDGKKNILNLRIDNSLMKEDKFIIEDLVIEAINNANKKVDVEVNNKMLSIMNEMGIPNHFLSMIPFINSK